MKLPTRVSKPEPGTKGYRVRNPCWVEELREIHEGREIWGRCRKGTHGNGRTCHQHLEHEADAAAAQVDQYGEPHKGEEL